MEFYYWQNQVLPIYHFQELASTNSTAWQLFQQGKISPFVVTADQQTAGKGQWGRQWVSCQGGLYLSLLLSPKISIEQPFHLTISTSCGVTELFSAYQIPVQIKWLNDLVLQGKKLGGVLTESRINNKQLKAFVIGIGINWNNPVPEMGIALKDYLYNTKIDTELRLYSDLNFKLSDRKLPKKIATINDLKYIVLTGILFGYDCYFQEGFNTILPRYEARLINELDR